MVTFITDTGCDIPKALNLPYEVEYLPLRVFLKNQEYDDKVTITPEELYNDELKGELASTSLPRPEIIEKRIKGAAEKSEYVYVITISAKLSNTHDLIKNIVNSLNLKNVKVLDSKTASIKQAYVLLKAMEYVQKRDNLTQAVIDSIVSNSLLVFYVPTLEYLYKGGRIGKAKALLGKVLNIKPILTTDNEGEVSTLATARSVELAISSMANLAKNFVQSKGLENSYSIVGGYTIGSTKVNLERLLSNFSTSSVIGSSTIGSAIAAHVGPEAFGLVIGERIEL
ncbi:DegV family protein [Fervidobacterium riparium]|uniref:EDD domain protein, DegV family n=1 Tax=Fervidobacterium gondwanense DSM 13020 TaxID=1121883 RepID=A0A1M7S7X7_FERGO|nr:DegV family protein [Fervidobacterium gondwanense]UXF00914.1 fatty acid-binding protein DegV [Fervidobacterium riparium]SHN54422.1 EDD domain protein, DegV family [Fervidobacterium gondwanense DSM 13020]